MPRRRSWYSTMFARSLSSSIGPFDITQTVSARRDSADFTG